jgi:hypothetical protein
MAAGRHSQFGTAAQYKQLREFAASETPAKMAFIAKVKVRRINNISTTRPESIRPAHVSTLF